LANLGNFSNRVLKFLASSFKKVIPSYEGERNPVDELFVQNLLKHFVKYVDLMELVKLKDGLRTAMEYSSECNLYMQENKPWELAKSNPARCA